MIVVKNNYRNKTITYTLLEELSKQQNSNSWSSERLKLLSLMILWEWQNTKCMFRGAGIWDVIWKGGKCRHINADCRNTYIGSKIGIFTKSKILIGTRQYHGCTVLVVSASSSICRVVFLTRWKTIWNWISLWHHESANINIYYENLKKKKKSNTTYHGFALSPLTKVPVGVF